MARELTGALLKDKWRVDALLGEGGVAAVYAATHRNGKRVAVKVLHPHLASMPEVRERFLREGYLANRVEHPGAVSVADDDVTDDGLVFLVMELLEGESLEKRLSREGKLPLPAVLAITGALLDVLAAAHAKGIVHRDIKPENIYLCRDGGQKLLDFGIARLHEQTAGKNATQSGAAMGTPSYMPPEQARGRWEMVDARSDVWAVGATMFALLTGHCVHEAETVNETLLLAMAQPARPLASLWPQAPAAVAAIVDRALAFNMNERWPDALTMRAAVEDAKLGVAPPVRPPAVSAPAAGEISVPAMPAAVAATQVAPEAVRGTVLATSVSDRPAGPAGFLATTRGRVVLGAGIGGAVLGTVLVLVVVGRGRTDEHATASGSTLSSPPASAVTALPTAVLAPESAAVAATSPPTATAPSASVEIDVSQLPVVPPAPTTTGAPPAVLPVRRVPPVTTAAAATAPAATRPVSPASDPLGRRH